MLTKESVLHFLSSNKEHLRQEFQVEKLGIFGSFARNEQTEDSDVDVLAEFSEKAYDLFTIKYHLRLFLEKNFQRPVDVCNPKYLKPYVKDVVMRDAIYV